MEEILQGRLHLENQTKKQQSRRTVNALIVYDDSAMAEEASAVLAKILRQTEETESWKVQSCEANSLAALTGSTPAENSQADLIILALNPAQSSSDLMEWLELWAKFSRVQEAALAVFGSKGGDAASTPAILDLSRLAARHELSFICGATFPFQNNSTTTGTATAKPDGYEHWGINE